MTKVNVLDVITEEVLAVLPHLSADQITQTSKLVDLGADSLDRSEIVQQSMRKLGIRLRPADLAKVENIGGLIAQFSVALEAV